VPTPCWGVVEARTLWQMLLNNVMSNSGMRVRVVLEKSAFLMLMFVICPIATH